MQFLKYLNRFTDKPIYQFQNQNRFNEYRFKQIYRFSNLMIRFDLTISNRFKRFDLKKLLNDLMTINITILYRFNDSSDLTNLTNSKINYIRNFNRFND